MAEDNNILDFYPDGEEDSCAEDSYVTLVDDEGNEVEMSVVDIVEHKGENYVILLPVENIESGDMQFAVTKIEYDEHDPIRGCAVVQPCEGRYLVVNPPARPLRREELDALYALPYTRQVHPMYKHGIPAIEEVQFSITHNRGCFGGCNFCALAFHQGRMVTSRSIESVLEEAELLTHEPGFKGYIHDVGGPTANFRLPSCKKQATHGMCPGKKCLAPEPCKALQVDHTEYLSILRKHRSLPGVKRVFIRSCIRFD